MEFAELAAIEDGYANTPIIGTIAPDDEMWRGGETWYFDVGRDGLRNVLRALSVSRLQKVSSILDIPCGHGRVARHIRAAFPEVYLGVCDLNQSGVDFCRNVFGAEGIYSEEELTNLEFDRKFDVIWVGSLFTHLDADRARRWLAHLCKYLNQHGVLVATFHGEWSIQVHNTHSLLIREDKWQAILNGFEKDGWGYATYDGFPDFGVSLARPWRVIEMASAIPGIRIGGYQERGWAGNHDVLTLMRTDRLEDLARKEDAVAIHRLVEQARTAWAVSQTPTADGIQERLHRFFCQPVTGGTRQTVIPYTQLSPGVHLGFDGRAEVDIMVEPNPTDSPIQEISLNTVTIVYRGPSRFLSFEAYCAWSDIRGVQRYDLEVHCVPNRLVSCHVVIRLPEINGHARDVQITAFDLPQGETAFKRSGPILLPADMEFDDGRKPLLLVFFDNRRELEIQLRYISLRFE